MHGACNLIPINAWQRLDDFAHRAGATREGGDDVVHFDVDAHGAIVALSRGVVPALALTAFARVEDRIKVLSSGFQMPVAKPVQSDELITAIANLSSPASERF